MNVPMAIDGKQKKLRLTFQAASRTIKIAFNIGENINTLYCLIKKKKQTPWRVEGVAPTLRWGLVARAI